MSGAKIVPCRKRGNSIVMKHSKVYSIMTNLSKMKWNLVVKNIIIGIIVGLLAALYRLILEFGLDIARQVYTFLRNDPVMILPWLCVIIVVSVLLTILVKIEPMASGSGIPQVEGLLIFGMKMRGLVILPVRFLAGLLSAFFQKDERIMLL